MPTPSYPSASNDPGYRPSGGTALTAAGLAIPGGIVSLIFGIGAISGVQALSSDVPGDVTAGIYIALIGGFLSALALLVGAGLIFGGKPPGRWLVVAGCVIVIACLITVSAMIGNRISDVLASNSDYANSNGAAAATGTAIGVAVLYSIPAIATFVLAIVPVSGRYLAFRSGGSSGVITPAQNFGYQAPQQQGYGQQPGYPQQQGFPPSTPGGFPQQGGFPQNPQTGGNYPPSNPGGFPQQPPNNPPQQW
jgi:hypothetical protein